mmetsp:Transcript_10114/g.22392  ORF Transcript_10114/g.22392 Transcript_10114/m.22392 type:complete len:373 (-) Transcript_10114:32-1150(-)
MTRAYGVSSFDEEKRLILQRVADAFTIGEFLQHDFLACSQEVLSDRDVALAVVSWDGMFLGRLPQTHHNDKAVVLAAVTKQGEALRFASGELRADRDIALAAMKQDGRALHYVSRALFADKDFALEAVKISGRLLSQASDELRADGEVVLAAVKNYGRSLEFAHPTLQAAKSMVEEAIKQSGLALEFASIQLKADKDIVLPAMKRSAEAFRFASVELRADKDVLLVAARYCRSGRIAKSCYDQASAALRNAISYETIKQVSWAAIAVQGEGAPIVSAALTQLPGSGAFHCEAVLMSGATLACRIDDAPSTDWWDVTRPGPILNDLAVALLDEVKKCLKVDGLQNIFIMFVGHGEPVPVSPWDWDRSLTEFLQ